MVGNVSVNVFEPPEFYAWEKGNDRFSINTYENFQILGKFKRFQAKILYCKVRFYKLMLLCCWQVAKKNWKIITKCLHFPSCHQAVKITHLKNSFCFSISYLLYLCSQSQSSKNGKISNFFRRATSQNSTFFTILQHCNCVI